MPATRRARATRRWAHRDDRGFTLIELPVVILIIGILAAIAIPVFLSSADQARSALVTSAMANARVDLVLALVEEGELPPPDAVAPVLAKYSTDGVSLSLFGESADFCLQGTHSALSDTWASTGTVPPQRASCAASGDIVLP